MPNGGMTEAKFEELDRFFQPIAGCLERFASSHNLLLERYYHDSPCWSLRFAHPAGGSASIDVSRASEKSVTVSGSWWLDVYSEFTRYLRDAEEISCPLEPDAIDEAIRSQFAEMLGWQSGIWSRIARDYEDIWSKYSESDFNRMGPHFPHPRQLP
jgi:hypothetical protein